MSRIKTNPLVSVLIPCFNAAQYVGEAIESALSQTYAPIEVIVVDDGSTDSSLESISKFAGRQNFRFETGPNRGGNAARNLLLKLAQGDFIQFLDADDLLLPNKVSVQANAFDDDVDVVFCDFLEFHTGDTEDEVPVQYSSVDCNPLEYFIAHSVITMLPLHRRRLLDEVGGFNESLPCCQEYDLHIRLATEHWHGVVHMPELLCKRRRVPNSISANEARVFSVQAALMEQLLQELNTDERLTQGRANAIARNLYNCGRHLARHGNRRESKDAFRLALNASPHSREVVTWPLRALSYLVGPYLAERARSLALNLCRTL
jgi:glycosyltransferase involved in cell wall biosynthesis